MVRRKRAELEEGGSDEGKNTHDSEGDETGTGSAGARDSDEDYLPASEKSNMRSSGSGRDVFSNGEGEDEPHQPKRRRVKCPEPEETIFGAFDEAYKYMEAFFDRTFQPFR